MKNAYLQNKGMLKNVSMFYQKKNYLEKILC